MMSIVAKYTMEYWDSVAVPRRDEMKERLRKILSTLVAQNGAVPCQWCVTTYPREITDHCPCFGGARPIGARYKQSRY